MSTSEKKPTRGKPVAAWRWSYDFAIVVLVTACFMAFFHFAGEAVFDLYRGDRWLAIEISFWLGLLAVFLWMCFRPGLRWRTRVMGVVTPLSLMAFFSAVKLRRDADLMPYGLEYRRPGDRYQRLAEVDGPVGAEPVGAEPVDDVQGLDYPQFLGPDRRAALPDLQLATDWEQRPPRELWRINVGAGWSSFATRGERVFTQEQQGDSEVVTCYQLRTGKLVWRHADPGGRFSIVTGDGPQATPTVTRERVYSMGVEGLLNCLNARTGDVVWSRRILKDLKAEPAEWGKSCSPLVVDDLVVVTGGAETGPSLAAYDRVTGELAWTGAWGEAEEERGTIADSYASPALVELRGAAQILNLEDKGVAAYDPATGTRLWRHAWPWRDESPKVAQPIVLDGNRVFISSAYSSGSAMFQVDHDERRGYSTRSLWVNRSLKTKISNVVVRGDYIYGLDSRILACVDANTGERTWKRGRYGHGQILLVGDALLVTSEMGGVSLVEATPKEYRELASFQAFSDRTWNNPALTVPDKSAGLAYLLLRNAKEAACYELRMKEPPAEASE